jgi:catechol 2,3-dioxygenase-like lactoylglutathione lyase family enzyme
VRTAASLKQALLTAKSIAYTANGASRPAIDKMIAQLGIARELEPKARLTAAGSAPASVGAGESELVLTLISEILPEPGVELAGPLPADFQSYIGFSAALWAKGTTFEPAQAFIAFLKGADAAATFAAKGMDALTAGATEPLTFDHMHLAFADTAAATAWYIRYLGALARPDGTDGVFFGPIRFNMRQTEHPAPSSGSVIDAIGISYANLDERMKTLEGSRAKILQGPRDVPGLFRMAVIEDPWGTKIELVQDRQLLGFHHVRVRATDPAAMQKWFADVLGGEPAKMGTADGLKFGGIWLTLDRADTPPATSEGTVIDHLGFRTRDIRAEVAALKTKGVKATGEPRQDANVATTFATFIEGATGRIELTQR